VLVQGARNINGYPWAARRGWGEGHESWERWKYRPSAGGVLEGNKQRRVRQHGKPVKE